MKAFSETKLINLITKLSSSELEGLAKYAVYAESRESVVNATERFLEEGFERLNKEDFFQLCHPDPDFSFTTNRFQTLLNAILDVAYEFLALEQIRANSPQRYEVVLSLARTREWNEEVLDVAKKLNRLLRKVPENPEHYHLNFYKEECVLEAGMRLGNLNPEEQVHRSWQQMERLTQIEALRYQCVVLDRQLSNYQVPAEMILPEFYLDLLLHRNKIETSRLAQAYFALWGMLRDPDSQEKFNSASQTIQLAVQDKALDLGIQQECLGLVYNHALRRVKIGLESHRVIVSLMFQLVDLNEHGIHPHQLKNIIALLANDGNLTEAKQVLQRFNQHIQGDDNHQALKYNQAVISFSEGDFRRAFRLFKEVIYAPNGDYLKLDGRLYLWKCQIELCLSGNEFDAHWYEFEKEKSRQFFRRFKYRSDHSRSFYRSYFQVLRRMYHALSAVNPLRRMKQFQALLVEVSQKKAHPLRRWAIATIDRALRWKGGG